MTWRLTGHKNPHRGSACVHRLVRLSRSDLNPLACSHREVVMLNLHRQLALKHKEKLPRMRMMVARFAGSRSIRSSMMFSSGVRTRYQPSQLAPHV
jgi:hypothetical protein